MVASMVLSAGCGSGSSADDRSKVAREGVYEATATVEKTDIKDDEKGSTADMEVLFSCANDDCTKILQRTTDRGRYATTVELEETDGTLTGEATRTAPCEGDAKEKPGIATERYEWTWEQGKGDALVGELQQTFTGCGEEFASTNSLRTKGKPGPLPYLEGEAADELKKEITAYDEAMAKVYDQFPKCQEQMFSDDKVEQGIRCHLKLIETWGSAVDRLEAYAKEDAPEADGACGEALETLQETSKVGAALDAARVAFAKALKVRDLPKDPTEAVLRQNEPFQFAITDAARLCIAPDDLEGLGDDGELKLDVNQHIRPGGAAAEG